MSNVAVVNWNPRRAALRTRSWSGARIGRRVNNFGDLLGPLIVAAVLEERGLSPRRATEARRLLAVGSILRLARDGDVIWGIGANGKSLELPFEPRTLDIRAVRGPRTSRYLTERGFEVPTVFGDPGLLVGRYWPRDNFGPASRGGIAAVPNLHDLASWTSAHDDVVDPTSPLDQVFQSIATADFVAASSLHALVLADSWGVPSRPVRSEGEPAFKYLDYYEGTGRFDVPFADSVDDALRMGPVAAPQWSERSLLEAFPAEMFRPKVP